MEEWRKLHEMTAAEACLAFVNNLAKNELYGAVCFPTKSRPPGLTSGFRTGCRLVWWAVLSLPDASAAARVTHCGNNRLVDRANHPWDQGVGDACGVSATVAACSSVTKHTPLGRSRGRHWCSNADWLNLCVGAGWPGVSPLTAINSAFAHVLF